MTPAEAPAREAANHEPAEAGGRAGSGSRHLLSKRLGALGRLLKTAIANFDEDEGITRAAALALYTALSLAPTMVLLLWGASAIGPTTRQALVGQLTQLLGPGPANAVHEVLANLGSNPELSSLPAAFSIGMLVFSATAVFAELQRTLNRMWDVEPPSGRVVREFIRTRLTSAVRILAVGLLLLISFFVSSVVVLLFGQSGLLARAFSFGGSVFVFSLAFAAIYKGLPDCKVSHRDALVGGLLTATLFSLGKELIGVYLGSSHVGSAYGTAGSLLLLLVWVYYSAVVFLFGAELTQAYSNQFGDVLVPRNRAGRRGRG